MNKRYIKGVTIYLDEHVPSEIKIPFQEMKLRTLEISKTKKYAGRNEFDYIHELFSEHGVFITSDWEFVRSIINQKIKHAGIVYLPKEIDREEKIAFSWAVAGYIRGFFDPPHRSVHNIVISHGYDGLHSIEKGVDKLVISLDWLEQEALRIMHH